MSTPTKPRLSKEASDARRPLSIDDQLSADHTTAHRDPGGARAGRTVRSMSSPTADPADFEACADHEQVYPIAGSCPECDLVEARELVAIMIMDPHEALWTLALYAGEPDPGGWELGDGTAVDLDACVLALADAVDRADRMRMHQRIDAVKAQREEARAEAKQAWASRNSADATSTRLAAEMAEMRTRLLQAESDAKRLRVSRDDALAQVAINGQECDDLAREVERLRKLHTAGVADAVRMAAELAGERGAADEAKAEAERLRGERDRWKAAAQLLELTNATTIEALRCLDDPDDESRNARALRRIIETGAPEGEQPKPEPETVGCMLCDGCGRCGSWGDTCEACHGTGRHAPSSEGEQP